MPLQSHHTEDASQILLAIRVFVECINAFYNTLRPSQNGRHCPDDIFKWIFLNEKVRIAIQKSLKFAPKGSIDYIAALFQILAWRRSGDKPLSDAMMA